MAGTGQDKAIETTGSRSRLNIVGALNLSDIGRTVIDEYESINSENIVRFFCKLRENYPLTHKLHLILDGAGYHRSDMVKEADFFAKYRASLFAAIQPKSQPDRTAMEGNERAGKEQCLLQK